MAEQTTIPATWLRDGVPDWSAIDREITCSRCGYDLRTLREPRCPECGLQFEWHHIFDALFTVSPWLFEHQWRRKPVRSLIATLIASLRPRRYWTNLSIHLRPDATGLWLQFIAAFLLPNALRFLLMGSVWLALRIWLAADGTSLDPCDAVRVMAFGMTHDFLVNREVHAAIAGTTGVAAAFSLIQIAALCSLRQSLARCRVRPVQMLRVAVGAALPFWTLVGAILLGSFTLQFTCSIVHYAADGVVGNVAKWICGHQDVILWPSLALAVAFGFRHLTIGLSQYLGLPRAGLVIVLTSILAGLLLLVVFDLVTGSVAGHGVRRIRSY
ncbi:MAG: hypothetical protein SF069_08825 [Phycisphaerae bacterium]|nr:hypothetical protein [Phycisphaerae bacterium]